MSFRRGNLDKNQKQPPEVFHFKIHRETPVPESLFLRKLKAWSCIFLKKEALAQLFSSGFCEIFKRARNYFYVGHKNRRKHYQYFKLLFITVNSDLITWNQTLTHKKLKLSFTSSIYLVVLPLEMWRGLKQTNVYQTFFLLCLKRNDQQINKRSSCKNRFLQCVCY